MVAAVSFSEDPFRRALRGQAEESFQKSGGDREAAAATLYGFLRRKIKAEPARVDVLLYELAQRLVREAATDQRQRIARRTASNDEDGGQCSPERHCSSAARAGASWSPPANTGADMVARRRNDETVFDWQLPGGLKLGLGTLVQIRAAQDYYAGVETSSRAKRSLMAALLKRLRGQPDGTRVQDVIDQRELAQLFQINGVTS